MQQISLSNGFSNATYYCWQISCHPLLLFVSALDNCEFSYLTVWNCIIIAIDTNFTRNQIIEIFIRSCSTFHCPEDCNIHLLPLTIFPEISQTTDRKIGGKKVKTIFDFWLMLEKRGFQFSLAAICKSWTEWGWCWH